MNIQVTKINPVSAQDILDMNTANRKLNQNRISFLANQMEKGKWDSNGDSIRISKNNVLMDGQHRLHAIIKSGVEIETLLITGLEFDVFKTIDTGKSRSGGDVLSVIGQKNTRNLAAALLVVEDLMTGNTGFSRKIKVSNEDVLEMFEKYRGIEVFISNKQKVKFMIPSVANALHYIFYKINPEKCTMFFDHLETGAGLEAFSPIRLLRERLIDNTISKGKMTKKYMIALSIKAWNAFVDGRALKSLRFRDSGDNPESFPAIKGLR